MGSLVRLEDFNSAFAICDCVALGKLVISASDSSGARLVESSSREIGLVPFKNGLFDLFKGEGGVLVLQVGVEGGLDQVVEVEVEGSRFRRDN